MERPAIARFSRPGATLKVRSTIGTRSVSITSVKTELANDPRPPPARTGCAPARRGAWGGWLRGDGLRDGSTSEVQSRALARLHGVQVVHDDDHGLGLFLRDQVVHDHVDVPLNVPPLLVLSPAVQQIEHFVPLYPLPPQ